MAAIQQKSGKGDTTQAINIDFTPMVDLGFLLITFFMLTTTMIKQHELTINVPPKDAALHSIKKTPTIMNIELDRDGVFYYLNKDSLNKVALPVSNKEMSNKISLIKNELLDGNQSELAIMLTPNETTPLHQIINCMDAIHNARVEKYCFK